VTVKKTLVGGRIIEGLAPGALPFRLRRSKRDFDSFDDDSGTECVKFETPPPFPNVRHLGCHRMAFSSPGSTLPQTASPIPSHEIRMRDYQPWRMRQIGVVDVLEIKLSFIDSCCKYTNTPNLLVCTHCFCTILVLYFVLCSTDSGDAVILADHLQGCPIIGRRSRFKNGG